jgi:hypothetical protein
VALDILGIIGVVEIGWKHAEPIFTIVTDGSPPRRFV